MIWLDYLGTNDEEDNSNGNDIADVDTWCYGISISEDESDND